MLCVISYKQSNPDTPDCTGPPMSLSNKFSGDISIPYTYSIQFKVSSVLLKPEFLLELYPRLAQILLHVEDSQTVVVVF